MNVHVSNSLIPSPREAVDTYGYRPLHRMASNNLAVGAAALLDAGADPKAPAGIKRRCANAGNKGETDVEDTESGENPMDVARSAGAWDVVQLLLPYYTSGSGASSAGVSQKGDLPG